MSEWISTEKEMPERWVNVLITNGFYIGHAKLAVDIWKMCGSDDLICNKDVTHWMPLPEPPEPNS